MFEKNFGQLSQSSNFNQNQETLEEKRDLYSSLMESTIMNSLTYLPTRKLVVRSRQYFDVSFYHMLFFFGFYVVFSSL